MANCWLLHHTAGPHVVINKKSVINQTFINMESYLLSKSHIIPTLIVFNTSHMFGKHYINVITVNWTVETSSLVYLWCKWGKLVQLRRLCLPGSGSCTNRPLTLQSRFILSISSSSSSWETELGRTTVSLEIPGEHIQYISHIHNPCSKYYHLHTSCHI